MYFFNCSVKNLETMSLVCPFHPGFQPGGQPLIPICLDMLLILPCSLVIMS